MEERAPGRLGFVLVDLVLPAGQPSREKMMLDVLREDNRALT